MELFDVENIVTLKSGLEVTQDHSLKMVPFKSKDTVSYSHSIATMAVSSAVSTQYTNMTQPARHRTIATVALRSLARLRSAAKITIES